MKVLLLLTALVLSVYGLWDAYEGDSTGYYYGIPAVFSLLLSPFPWGEIREQSLPEKALFAAFMVAAGFSVSGVKGAADGLQAGVAGWQEPEYDATAAGGIGCLGVGLAVVAAVGVFVTSLW